MVEVIFFNMSVFLLSMKRLYFSITICIYIAIFVNKSATGKSDSKLNRKARRTDQVSFAMKKKMNWGTWSEQKCVLCFNDCKITRFSSFSISKYFCFEQLNLLKRDMIWFCSSLRIMKRVLSPCCGIGNVAPIATTRNQQKNEFELLQIERELSEIEEL